MIPLGMLTVVTGVTGSGKSTLVHDVMYKALLAKAQRRHRYKEFCERLEGDDQVREVVIVDQSPIGRTPRSNPATYLKAFDAIREVFADTPDAKRAATPPGIFRSTFPAAAARPARATAPSPSRCSFWPTWNWSAKNAAARASRAAFSKSGTTAKIFRVLRLTVREAIAFFSTCRRSLRSCACSTKSASAICASASPRTTLSGGEAQRVKLAAHLPHRKSRHPVHSRRAHHRPAFRRHRQTARRFPQADRIWGILLVIEHNLDVIKSADWLIDLGPEGGDQGGKIIATGTPEQVATKFAVAYRQISWQSIAGQWPGKAQRQWRIERR